MKAIWCIAVLSWQWCVLEAQSVSTLIGARANGIGYASSCVTDEWSIFNNIGGLGKVKGTTAGFSYDARTTLRSANRMATVLAVPMKLGVVGAGVFRFGDDLYSEQILSTGFSNTFGIASLGIKLNYIQYRIQGFGSKGVPSISFGGVTQLTRQLSIGVHIINLNQPQISELNDQRIPTLLIAGIAFKPDDKVFLTTEIEKDLDYNAIWKAGLEYVAHKKVSFRTGFNLHPSAGFFGIGLKPKNFLVDYAFQYDPNLGGSHQASVGYKLYAK